jgi:hypothetical protein
MEAIGQLIVGFPQGNYDAPGEAVDFNIPVTKAGRAFNTIQLALLIRKAQRMSVIRRVVDGQILCIVIWV